MYNLRSRGSSVWLGVWGRGAGMWRGLMERKESENSRNRRSKQRHWLKGALHVGNGNGMEAWGRREGRWVGFGTWGKGVKAPTSSLLHSPRKRRRLSFENWIYHWLSPKTFSTQIILLLNHRNIPGGPTLSIIIHLQFSFAFIGLYKIRCKLCFREWLGDTKFWLIEKCNAWHDKWLWFSKTWYSTYLIREREQRM